MADEMTKAKLLAESHQLSQRLLEMVQAHSEEFLIQPQQFEGPPRPILILIV